MVALKQLDQFAGMIFLSGEQYREVLCQLAYRREVAFKKIKLLAEFAGDKIDLVPPHCDYDIDDFPTLLFVDFFKRLDRLIKLPPDSIRVRRRPQVIEQVEQNWRFKARRLDFTRRGRHRPGHEPEHQLGCPIPGVGGGILIISRIIRRLAVRCEQRLNLRIPVPRVPKATQFGFLEVHGIGFDFDPGKVVFNRLAQWLPAGHPHPQHRAQQALIAAYGALVKDLLHQLRKLRRRVGLARFGKSLDLDSGTGIDGGVQALPGAFAPGPAAGRKRILYDLFDLLFREKIQHPQQRTALEHDPLGCPGLKRFPAGIRRRFIAWLVCRRFLLGHGGAIRGSSVGIS
ncbi:MAG: hypothetical protein OXF82_03470 [Gammaproteobacteria bacterium]|nr:hypothetical protein [Gammaproteobacteria bacterium]